jgi:hypothetical protein
MKGSENKSWHERYYPSAIEHRERLVNCTHNAFFHTTLLGISLSRSLTFAISRGQTFRIRTPYDIACSSTCWFLDLNYHRPSHSLQMPVRHQPAYNAVMAAKIPGERNIVVISMPSLACPPSIPSRESGRISIIPAIRGEGLRKRTNAFIVPCSACLWFLRNLGSVPLSDGYLEVFGFLMLQYAQNVSADLELGLRLDRYSHWLEEAWSNPYDLEKSLPVAMSLFRLLNKVSAILRKDKTVVQETRTYLIMLGWVLRFRHRDAFRRSALRWLCCSWYLEIDFHKANFVWTTRVDKRKKGATPITCYLPTLASRPSIPPFQKGKARETIRSG